MTSKRGPEEERDWSPLPADTRLYDARTYTVATIREFLAAVDPATGYL